MLNPQYETKVKKMTQREAVLQVWNMMPAGVFNLDRFERAVYNLLIQHKKSIRRCGLTAMMRTLRGENKYAFTTSDGEKIYNGKVLSHTFNFSVVNDDKGLYKKIL
ncbi:unnamed protein product [marine sediment metagenome]|uniref:Uncharacterized protein n=1 Tax=marine sediment metagenome TaxID=412755 RepID=X0YFH6_9ZZZZ